LLCRVEEGDVPTTYINNQHPEWDTIQTQSVMSNQIQKLEQLHQLVNNEVTGPKFYEFLDKNIPTDYDSNYGIENGGWSPYINLNEYLCLELGKNVLNINTENEKDFFMHCVWNNDFDAFLEEFNGSYHGDSDVVLSTELDWERYTQNILNVINK